MPVAPAPGIGDVRLYEANNVAAPLLCRRVAASPVAMRSRAPPGWALSWVQHARCGLWAVVCPTSSDAGANDPPRVLSDSASYR